MIGYYLALLDRLLGTGTLIEFVLARVVVGDGRWSRPVAGRRPGSSTTPSPSSTPTRATGGVPRRPTACYPTPAFGTTRSADRHPGPGGTRCGVLNRMVLSRMPRTALRAASAVDAPEPLARGAPAGG